MLLAALVVVQVVPVVGDFWAGVSYYASKRGASPEVGLAINLIGAFHATVIGVAIGGPVGAVAGAVSGLSFAVPDRGAMTLPPFSLVTQVR